MKKLPERQTFCAYCRMEYVTPKRLQRHVLRSHQGTNECDSLVSAEEEDY